MIIARPLPEGIGVVKQVFGANVADYLPWGFPGHEGLDYSCPIGTPVLACTTGIVTFAGTKTDANRNYGIHIIIDHGLFESFYCHLSGLHVAVTDYVTQGLKIADSGNSGANTTGPHLHFGIRVRTARNGSKGFVDPWALRVLFGNG